MSISTGPSKGPHAHRFGVVEPIISSPALGYDRGRAAANNLPNSAEVKYEVHMLASD